MLSRPISTIFTNDVALAWGHRAVIGVSGPKLRSQGVFR